MNSQELRNLQEAYLNVYQEIDESATRIAPKIRGAKDDVKYMDGRSPGGMSISGNSQVSGAGYMRRGGGVQTQPNPNMPPVNPGRMDRGTRIDLKYRQALLKAKGGSSSSAGAGSASGTAGRDQYQVGGGEGYGVLGIKLANSYEPDLFDVILEYLITEGYADTNDSALAIMSNMGEDWRVDILEARVDDGLSDEEKQDARNKRSGNSTFTRRNLTKASRDKSPKGLKPSEPTQASMSVAKYTMALNQPRTSAGKKVRGEIEMNKAERGSSGRRGS